MSAAVITPPDDEPVRNELADKLQVRRTANYIATNPNLYADPALTLGEVSPR